MESDPERVAELLGSELYRREFGWTAEDYALDRELWPETYICPECAKEMRMKVSGTHEAQTMTFTCECGYVFERKP
jgi:lysyl-tRNA synthetase class I